MLTFVVSRAAQKNPNALEITGLVDGDKGLYDPEDDGDPTTGVSCSATAPLLVALAASAGLTLANGANFAAIHRVNPYLVWIASY